MPERTRPQAYAAECRILTRYLTGADPSPYVTAAYQRAHEVGGVDRGLPPSPIDRALLRVAAAGPAPARMADAFSALFVKGSLLRRKLVLLVAILESRADTADRLDRAEPCTPGRWMLWLAGRAFASVLRACAATVVIVPLVLWYRLVPERGA